ncbi:MAG: hypothetical protein KME12_18465 [Trichocoleus desertorum ATA4-8-CV12]|jgi:hypothetical protein|nr:hypothetical protein [Trichocoleus desertorum ATA4-8-CV12]
MQQRNWIYELEEYLEERYSILPVHESIAGSNPALRIDPALDSDEAKYFILGLEAELFSIDDEGYAQSSLLLKLSGSKGQQKGFQLFWHFTNKGRKTRALFREGISQLASASSLILKYGWDISQVQIEARREDFGALARGVDLVIKSAAGKILICGEVKKDSREFEKLIEDFRYCCQQGQHNKSDCKCRSNHPKYELCAFIKPAYFWAVSPGRELCYRLSYLDRKILLAEVASLPHRSEIDVLF